MHRLGCTFPIIIGVIIIAVLVIVAFLSGAIGSNFLGGKPLLDFISLSQPKPELPPEAVFTLFGLRVTNTLLASWLTLFVLLVVSFLATRRMNLVPKGLQNLVEVGVEALLNFVENAAGHENGRRFFPIVATIFIFVLFNAWLSLIPGYGTVLWEGKGEGERFTPSHLEEYTGKEGYPAYLSYNGTVYDITGTDLAYLAGEDATKELKDKPLEVEELTNMPVVGRIAVHLIRGANTDVNLPLTLAVLSFIMVEYWGIRRIGFFRYMGQFVAMRRLLGGLVTLFRGKILSGFAEIFYGIIDVFVGLLELLSHFVRLISFTFRLFGNMTAGEILLLVVAFLVPWIVPSIFYGLELFMGFIQALIFAGLTLVFALVAVTPHEEEHS